MPMELQKNNLSSIEWDEDVVWDDSPENEFGSKIETKDSIIWDEPETPSWLEQQASDIVGVAQLGASIASSAVLSIPGALQAAGDWMLTGDAEAAKRGMEQWISKGYVPSNPTAAKAVEAVGSGYEYLAQGTEDLLGTEARMISEIGMVAAPFAGAMRVKPTSTLYRSNSLKEPSSGRKGLESDMLDSVDVRLLKHAPELQGRFRKMEAEGLRMSVEHVDAITPFETVMRSIKKAQPELYKQINDAALDQPYKGKGEVGAGISRVRTLLSESIGKEATSEIMGPLEAAMRQRGIDLKEVNPNVELASTSWMPRRVVHPEKLGVDLDGPIGKELQKIDADVASGKIDAYTAEELRTRTITSGGQQAVTPAKSVHEKRRVIRKLSEEQREAYAPIEEAIHRYFEDTAWAVAEKRFLGKGDTTQASIGKFMEAYIDHPKAAKIHEVMQARFGPGVRSGMDKGWRNLKELGYLGTIADFGSAVIQLSDLAGSIARQGLVPGAKAIRQSIGSKVHRAKKGAVDPEVVGFVDIMHEMATVRGGMNKLLDRTLEYSGFKTTDRFGKRVLLTAAKHRLMKSAQKGIKHDTKPRTAPSKIRQDYWWMEPEEFANFQRNVAKGDPKNPDMQFALVNELLDVQPMSLSQMPIKYLQMRNGKIFYALKTWAIRQVNRYREDVIKGDYTKALKYGAGLYAATESIDFSKKALAAAMTGKTLTTEDIQDDAVNNLLRMFFLSTYSLGKVKGGDAEEAVSSAVNLMPAGVGVIGDVGIGIWSALTGEEAPTKAIKRIPIVGRTAAALAEE